MRFSALSSLCARIRRCAVRCGRHPWLKGLFGSWIGSAVLAVCVLYGVNAWRTQSVPHLAPTWSESGTVVWTHGASFRLSEFRALHPDRAVAVLFWASWCGVCRVEEHSIDRLVHDTSVPLVVVATQSGDAAQIRQELSARGLDWDVVVDETGEGLAAYGLFGVPSFVVIDHRGYIRSAQMGYTSELGMRARLWWANW